VYVETLFLKNNKQIVNFETGFIPPPFRGPFPAYTPLGAPKSEAPSHDYAQRFAQTSFVILHTRM